MNHPSIVEDKGNTAKLTETFLKVQKKAVKHVSKASKIKETVKCVTEASGIIPYPERDDDNHSNIFLFLLFLMLIIEPLLKF